MTLDEIRKLIAEATPGPWGYCYDGSSTWSVGPAADPQSPQVASCWRQGAAECPDARFIAAARTLLPALLEVAEWSEKLADYVEDCYPGIQVTGRIREALTALDALKLP